MVDVMHWIAIIVSGSLFAYLTFAMFFPERFG